MFELLLMTAGVAATGAVLFVGAVALIIRQRQMQYWIGSYVRPAEPRSVNSPDEDLHVLIAVCDHFEPECYGATHQTACDRVARWVEMYPRLFESFRDVDGRPPQHTFFFPQDEYRPEYLDELAGLCARGFGDVDVHLHHDGDTAEQLAEKLESFRETLAYRHGLLRKDPQTGRVVYGFIHGNWALCNARPDGRWCGVDQELSVLLETGCYADFTLPSAPSNTQTATINSIYYAQDIPGQRKSHDRGIRSAIHVPAPADHLLMIQGALRLDWGSRKFGLIPRIENSDLHAGRPATLRRLKMWIDAGVTVRGRNNWRFVKLHTHGCKDGNIDTLLGPAMQQFHADLAAEAKRNPRFKYHYVTAWEMAQLVHQAEGGALTPDIAALQSVEPCLLGR